MRNNTTTINIVSIDKNRVWDIIRKYYAGKTRVISRIINITSLRLRQVTPAVGTGNFVALVNTILLQYYKCPVYGTKIGRGNTYITGCTVERGRMIDSTHCFRTNYESKKKKKKHNLMYLPCMRTTFEWIENARIIKISRRVKRIIDIVIPRALYDLVGYTQLAIFLDFIHTILRI